MPFHIADLLHVKDPFKRRGTRHLSAKLPAISRPQFPLSLLGVSRVVVDVRGRLAAQVGTSKVGFIQLAFNTAIYIRWRQPLGPNRRRRIKTYILRV
jgi:hypothetical protein